MPPELNKSWVEGQAESVYNPLCAMPHPIGNVGKRQCNTVVKVNISIFSHAYADQQFMSIDIESCRENAKPPKELLQ